VKIRLEKEVIEYLTKLKTKDKKAFESAKKQLKMFEADINYPSLRIHKLSGKLENVWSLSIGLKLRLLYFVKDGQAWGYMIGTHDEVYRKN